MSLPHQRNFRKYLWGGIQGKVVSLADADHKDRAQVAFGIMHQGSQFDVSAWILTKSLSLGSAGEAASSADSADQGATLPAAIVDGDPFGAGSSVPAWEDLLDITTPTAQLLHLKAQTMVVMKYIHELVPPLVEGQYIHVVHRTNALGAQRTEV